MSKPLKPTDPAYPLLKDELVSTPRVYRDWCYICRDMEFARLGMSLCSPCCQCSEGHVPADDTQCDRCEHGVCEVCLAMPAEQVCTCDSPCCYADVGVGVIDCGSQHCPTHGYKEGEGS